ncbi:MAG: hypothetical protein GY805_00450, partial [Chloroflexi bacterium]|nr:hypothetical protein [Chloroflexota bacterium]
MNLFNTNPVFQINLVLRRVIPIIFFVAALVLTAVLFLMQTQPAAAAVDCADSAWQVGDETDLNAAIVCYNAKPAGNYTLTLTQTISLNNASSTIISNATAGATLLLEGGGFTVDGLGRRPFEIATDTTVTIQNITITGGNIANPGGGIRNSGTLTVSNSTLSGNSATSEGGEGGGIYNRSGTLTVSN